MLRGRAKETEISREGEGREGREREREREREGGGGERGEGGRYKNMICPNHTWPARVQPTTPL